MEFKKEVREFVFIDKTNGGGRLRRTGDDIGILLADRPNTPVKITVEFLDENPTKEQYRYLYGVVYKEWQMCLFKYNGEWISLKRIDEELKKEFLFTDILNGVNPPTEENKSKAAVGRRRLSAFLERVIAAAAIRFNHVVTPPHVAAEYYEYFNL